jgi:hypothetical protein
MRRLLQVAHYVDSEIAADEIEAEKTEKEFLDQHRWW